MLAEVHRQAAEDIEKTIRNARYAANEGDENSSCMAG